jgi:hypothetical protein
MSSTSLTPSRKEPAMASRRILMTSERQEMTREEIDFQFRQKMCEWYFLPENCPHDIVEAMANAIGFASI